jgi:hypothetical protein
MHALAVFGVVVPSGDRDFGIGDKATRLFIYTETISSPNAHLISVSAASDPSTATSQS